jgi:hypothetical protein
MHYGTNKGATCSICGRPEVTYGVPWDAAKPGRADLAGITAEDLVRELARRHSSFVAAGRPLKAPADGELFTLFARKCRLEFTCCFASNELYRAVESAMWGTKEPPPGFLDEETQR